MIQQDNLLSFLLNSINKIILSTGFANVEIGNIIMIIIGIMFIYLAIKKDGTNAFSSYWFWYDCWKHSFLEGSDIGIKEEGTVLNILYGGVRYGWYPPLVFLGIGAMTDFASLISNPKLLLIGAMHNLGYLVPMQLLWRLDFLLMKQVQ